MPSERLRFFHACTAFEHKLDIGEPERMKVNLSLAGIFGNCCYFQIFVQFTRRVSWNIKERVCGNTPWNTFAGIGLLVFLDWYCQANALRAA